MVSRIKYKLDLPIREELDELGLLLGSIVDVYWGDAGRRGRRRGRAVGRGQTPGSGTERIDGLRLRGPVLDVVMSSHSERRPGVVLVATLLLLVVVVVLPRPEAGRRRHPVQVLLQVSPSALAAARLERQVVPLLGPEVLVSLALRPGARPPARLEVRQHGLLPGLEALPVHVPARGAVVIVAADLDRLAQVVQADGHVVAEALVVGHAAHGHVQVVVLESLVQVQHRHLDSQQAVVVIPTRSHHSTPLHPIITKVLSLFVLCSVLNSDKINNEFVPKSGFYLLKLQR